MGPGRARRRRTRRSRRPRARSAARRRRRPSGVGRAAEHPVEPPGGDVGERDRERADPAAAIGLALQPGDDRQRSARASSPRGRRPRARSPGPRASSGAPSSRAPSPRSATNSSAGAEVPDVAEVDVGHRGPGGDRDAERERGDRAAGVERAVDRVDHHPWRPSRRRRTRPRRAPRRSRRSSAPAVVQRLELGEDDVLRLAVDHQAAVAALADAGVLGARRDPAGALRTARCWAATILRQAPSQSSVGRPAASDRAIPAMLEAVGECPPTVTCRPRRSAASPPTQGGPLLVARRGRLGPHRGAGAAARGARGPWRAPRAGARPRALARRPLASFASGPRTPSTAPTRSSGSTPTRRPPRRCLREYSIEAGLDPFFTTVGLADRLAILLDRVDELPLRRHEIRGNPAGLLARLLRRIDVLKSEAVAPTGAARVGGRARARGVDRGRARARRARGRVRRALRAPRPHPRATRAASTAATWCSSSAGCSARRADVARGRRRALRRGARRRARGRRDRPPADARRDRRRTATLACACDPAQATPALARRRRRRAGRVSRRASRAPPRSTSVSPLRRPRRDPLLALRERSRPGPGGCSRGRAPARRGRGARRAHLRASPARAGARAAWSRRRSRSAACPTASPATRRSSAAPRSATCSPGCGCSPSPPTPRPSSAR